MAAGCSVDHTRDVMRVFECPVSFEPITDGLVDSCGHTFARETIEEIQQIAEANNEPFLCPISRQPIVSLAPNLLMNEAREAVGDLQDELNTTKKVSSAAQARIAELTEDLRHAQDHHEAREESIRRYANEAEAYMTQQNRTIERLEHRNDISRAKSHSKDDIIAELTQENAALHAENDSLKKRMTNFARRMQYLEDIVRIDRSVGTFTKLTCFFFEGGERDYYRRELRRLAARREEEPYYGDYA